MAVESLRLEAAVLPPHLFAPSGMESLSLLPPAAALSPHPPFSAAAALRLLLLLCVLLCVLRSSEVCVSTLLRPPSTPLLPAIICGGEICLFRPWLVKYLNSCVVLMVDGVNCNVYANRTALTYIDLADGNWHPVSKEAPEQILSLCNAKEDLKKKVHGVIDKYAERGLRSLAVARQDLPEKTKESTGTPWRFVAVLPLFDPPRHDSAETINKALDLGVNSNASGMTPEDFHIKRVMRLNTLIVLGSTFQPLQWHIKGMMQYTRIICNGAF
ncbi:hypothetical protein V2J09_004145 [Rumex salicifolius]